MPRITAGYLKNIHLDTADRDTRPLTDRIKISIFDTLGDYINSKTCLDLYGGSGSFIIEFISRGGESGVIIDKSPAAAAVITANLEKTSLTEQVDLLNITVATYLQNQPQRHFDLIFADPPFKAAADIDANFLKLAANHLVAKAVMIIRLPAEKPLSAKEISASGKFEALFSKKYGKSRVYYLQKI